MKILKILMLALSWLALVTGCIFLVWQAVAKAGESTGITAAPTLPTPSQQSPPNSRVNPQPGLPTSRSTTPRSKPVTLPTSTPKPNPKPTKGATAEISASPKSVTRSWSSNFGVVTARCQATKISLVSAQSNPPYQVKVEKYGPEELEIKFRGDENEIEIKSSCRGGTPTFYTEK